MFKVPESLKQVDVMGIQIPVIIDQSRCEHMGALGLFDGVIVLREEYEDHGMFMKTLVHEMFHAHCHTIGLQLDIQIEEVLATTSERLFVSASQTFAEIFSPMVADEEGEPVKRGRGRPRKDT